MSLGTSDGKVHHKANKITVTITQIFDKRVSNGPSSNKSRNLQPALKRFEHSSSSSACLEFFGPSTL